MRDMPAALLEWEKNLRRCLQEGRSAPNDETKRLALLRMLPKAQRSANWDTANKLYPTFPELLAKVQEMDQDDIDSKAAGMPMDVDRIDDDGEGESKETGQTLTGNEANGEDTLFMLQKRGISFRLCRREKE